jgi:hypothetical protein
VDAERADVLDSLVIGFHRPGNLGLGHERSLLAQR